MSEKISEPVDISRLQEELDEARDMCARYSDFGDTLVKENLRLKELLRHIRKIAQEGVETEAHWLAVLILAESETL